MKTPGAIPVVTVGDENEERLLEAPSAEPTLLGGWHTRPAHSLDEALAAWDAETWGNA